jgi:hypothetical protein
MLNFHIIGTNVRMDKTALREKPRKEFWGIKKKILRD